MSEPRLRSVELQPDIDLAATVHPILEGSMVIVEPGSVSFTKPLLASEVLQILGEPINNLIDQPFSPGAIHQGLKKLQYPNSRTMKNVGLVDPVAPTALLTQRPQINGLLSVIDHPNRHEVVQTDVRLFDRDLAELAAWDTIGGLKPSRIQKMADEFGITCDAMRIWRVKGGDRRNRPASLSDMGLDTTSFVEQFIAQQYRPKVTLPDRKNKLIPIEDLPASSWLHDPGYIKMVKELPPATPDELGERWDVLLRRSDRPLHVVRPKIMWGASALRTTRKWIEHGEAHGGRTTTVHKHSWMSQYRHFVHESTPPVYNPAEHRVEHTSSLLGVALLAHGVDQAAFKQALRELASSNQAWPRHRYYDRYRPAWQAGALIPIMHTPYITARLLGTDSFRALETLESQDSAE